MAKFHRVISSQWLVVASALMLLLQAPIGAQTSLADAEQKVQSVYQRVGPSVVRIYCRDADAKVIGAATGVVVSKDGLVLSGPLSRPFARLTFHLADGRTIGGKGLGWSGEWGVSMARLDGPGPWEFVPLTDAPDVKAGQPIVSLAYAVSESADVIARPLLRVSMIDRSFVGRWFMLPESPVDRWQDNGLIFDFTGRLIGIGSGDWPLHGPAATCTGLIRSMLDDMVAGKNLDEMRLAGIAALDDGNRNQSINDEVRKSAVAASVRIRVESEKMRVSGTIITPDGLIATCAHHFFMPGTKVIVGLSDGRDAHGEVVGLSLPSDIGWVRITEPAGPFPFVQLGNSAAAKAGDACLMVGYGPVELKDRQPKVRETAVIASPREAWSFELSTDGKAKLAGGDSGGGLFDAAGRLIAIHHGDRNPNQHGRVELFAKHRDELNGKFEQASASDLAQAENELRTAAESAGRSVVEILDGENVVAMGTIISADGRIITKASVLPTHPTCRSSNGQSRAATIVKVDREIDLAELKITASGLSPIEFGGRVAPAVGTFAAAFCSGKEKVSTVVISHPPLSFPAEHGWLSANLQDSAQGLVVNQIMEMPAGPAFVSYGEQLLKKGDILRRIDGHAVPDMKAYVALLDPRQPNAVGLAGDVVRLEISRADQRLEIQQVLGPPTWPRLAGQSARSSGFSNVYSALTTDSSPLCGGPIVDRDGRAIGIAIATRSAGWLVILPADRVPK